MSASSISSLKPLISWSKASFNGFIRRDPFPPIPVMAETDPFRSLAGMAAFRPLRRKRPICELSLASPPVGSADKPLIASGEVFGQSFARHFITTYRVGSISGATAKLANSGRSGDRYGCHPF